MSFSKTIEYKGAAITVDRERPADNWYIQVQLADGTYGYDGWWPDSAYKPWGAAVAEAKAGAWLDKEATPAKGEGGR